MAAKKKTTAPAAEVEEVKLSKQQLVKSERYSERRDLLNKILLDDAQYSISEVDSLIEQYMKGKVY